MRLKHILCDGSFELMIASEFTFTGLLFLWFDYQRMDNMCQYMFVGIGIEYAIPL